MERGRNSKKITQREAVFYQMYTLHRREKAEGKPHDFINVFDFMGEVYCKEVGKYGFVSHMCSARASELFAENKNWRTNENLFERKKVHGRSGAVWYAYRLNTHPREELIISDDLKRFYKQLRANRKPHDQNTTQAES